MRQSWFWLTLLLLPAAAGAQAPKSIPTESVTVTAAKNASPQVIERFIESFAAPTPLLGKLARWETGICPVAVGLRPSAIAFLLQRLKNNAARIGAPVESRPGCRANVEVVFTTAPQGLLDNIRKQHPVFLGYASSSAQADRLAQVIHPIQAWYTTATEGLNGQPRIDSGRTVGLGDSDEFSFTLGGMGSVTGLRMRDGRRSSLYHVIIVIDPTSLADREIGGIADYVSVLALSQLGSLDHCQPLASIMNMLAPHCAATATELTANDVAFLRGLYGMPLDGNLRMQTDAIAYRMRVDSK